MDLLSLAYIVVCDRAVAGKGCALIRQLAITVHIMVHRGLTVCGFQKNVIETRWWIQRGDQGVHAP